MQELLQNVSEKFVGIPGRNSGLRGESRLGPKLTNLLA